MPLYQFKAIAANGETIEGRESAESKSEIIKRLRDRQRYPLNIEEVVEKDIKDIRFFGKISIKHLAVFCRQFYTLLNSGITIVNALDILAQQTEHKQFKKVITELYEDVQKGFTFSEALEKHPDVFPYLMIHMVSAGEASGSLDAIMNRLSHHFEKEFKINNKIKNAMVYPTVLIVVAIGVLLFLLVVIMPTIVSFFDSSNVQLPLLTRIIIGISNFIRSYWYVILGIIFALMLLTRRAASTPDGQLMFDRWKFRFPIIKGLNRKIISARFTRTMSTLLSSGIPLLQALDNVAGAVGNKVVANGILSMKDEIRKGASLSTHVKNLGFFPPMVDNMIKIGEESGTLDDLLDKTANFYDEEVDNEITRLLTFIEPLMILFVGIIIAFIIISMYLPIFQLPSTLG